MTLTLLLIGGLAVLVAAVVVTTARGYQTTPALVGENTAVGLADAGADTLVGHGTHSVGGTRTDWHLTTVSALCDAEDLLDSLEMQGYEERELVVLGNSCFAVRWR